MTETFEENTTLSSDLHDEELQQLSQSSAYLDHKHFEAALTEIASNLIRGVRFKFEREIILGTGVVLLILSAIKVFLHFFSREEIYFFSSNWLWLFLMIWSLAAAWYIYRRVSIRDRIIDQRLCFCCGNSLLESPLDESDIGFCEECGKPFQIAEYLPPEDCVTALRRAHETMQKICPRAKVTPRAKLVLTPNIPDVPYYLYSSPSHYNRVMRKAASRVISDQMPFAKFSLLIYATLLNVIVIIGCYLWGSDFLYVMPVAVLALCSVVGFEIYTITKTVRRIKTELLCIGCGYPLKQLPVNDLNGGTCPECGRPYNICEYTIPPHYWNDSEWRYYRSLVMPVPDINELKTN